jgi:hypothetical protein
VETIKYKLSQIHILEELVMPEIGEVLEIKPVVHIIVGPELEIDKPVPFLQTLEMSWAVFDLQTSEVKVFDTEGGHFTCIPGNRYLVILRVADVKKGVQRITLDGSGMFRCATEPDNRGQSFESALPLPISIPHRSFSNTGAAPTLQDLIVVMKPDIGAFNYSKLSAGFHHFSNTPRSMEYFAFAGSMTFSAAASNSRGESLNASLTISP